MAGHKALYCDEWGGLPDKEFLALLDLRLAALREGMRRLATGEPLAYVLGDAEFMGRRFAVDRRVLIPRPETEGVVEAVLAALDPSGPQRVLDVGTGSGAIAVTLAGSLAVSSGPGEARTTS